VDSAGKEPVILAGLSNMNVNSGKSAKLECEVVFGKPKAEVKWWVTFHLQLYEHIPLCKSTTVLSVSRIVHMHIVHISFQFSACNSDCVGLTSKSGDVVWRAGTVTVVRSRRARSTAWKRTTAAPLWRCSTSRTLTWDCTGVNWTTSTDEPRHQPLSLSMVKQNKMK